MDGVCVDFRKAEEAMMRLRLAIGRGVLMVAMGRASAECNSGNRAANISKSSPEKSQNR